MENFINKNDCRYAEDRQIETNCIHLNEETDKKENFGAVSYPIYQSATFAHRCINDVSGYDYSRMQNPTRDRLEKIVASLEKGRNAIALSSGMAAISLVMELFSPGDHLVIDSDLYGGSLRLFNDVSKKNGITFTLTDCSDDGLEKCIHKNTRAIFLETPTNPMMRVCNIGKLAGIAEKHSLHLIVDNTFLSPYFMNPLELGADIVIHSGTKYLGGHNDTLAGFVIVRDNMLSERLRFLAKTIGAALAPFDSWLMMRGISTLPVRMEKAQENAFELAGWLKKQPDVSEVLYPGLPEHPGHELMLKQARGFGSMITFKVKSRSFALGVLENVRLISFAESLGGVESLITYPVTQTHADVPEKIRLKNGLTEETLRLSVGIENVKDIIADLAEAFSKTEKEDKRYV